MRGVFFFARSEAPWHARIKRSGLRAFAAETERADIQLREVRVFEEPEAGRCMYVRRYVQGSADRFIGADGASPLASQRIEVAYCPGPGVPLDDAMARRLESSFSVGYWQQF